MSGSDAATACGVACKACSVDTTQLYWHTNQRWRPPFQTGVQIQTGVQRTGGSLVALRQCNKHDRRDEMLSRNLYRARRSAMMILIGGSKVANSLQQFTLYSKSMIPLYLGPWTCVCDANNANPQIMHLSAHSSPTQMRQHGRSVAGTMHGQVQTAQTCSQAMSSL